MRHFWSLAGLAAVCIGVVVMVATYMIGCSNANAVNIGGTTLVTLGIIAYVYGMKKESKY